MVRNCLIPILCAALFGGLLLGLCLLLVLSGSVSPVASPPIPTADTARTSARHLIAPREASAQLETLPLPSKKPFSLRSALFDAEIPFDARTRHLHSLSGHLSQPEIDSLVVFLRSAAHREQNDPLLPGQRHALQNDALNLLRNQSLPAWLLEDLLQDLARSPDPVTADYALQHAGASLPQATGAARERLLTLLRQASARSEHTRAGTALLALHHGSETSDPGEPQSQVLTAHSLRLALDPQADPAARITALGLVALRELDPEKRLQTAEQALHLGGPLPYRLSALSLLASQADPHTKPRILATLDTLRETDPRALEAIRKLRLQLTSSL